MVLLGESGLCRVGYMYASLGNLAPTSDPLVRRFLPRPNVDHEAPLARKVEPRDEVVELVLERAKCAHLAHPVQEDVDEDARAQDVRRVVLERLREPPRRLQAALPAALDEVVRE
jgi:hypothetical protein